jgi:hypothetical protein
MTVTPDGLGRLPDAKKDGVPPWFVDIGEPEPLMSTAELTAAITRGEVPAGTLVWRLGMDNWVPYETLDEIRPTDAGAATANRPTDAGAATANEPIVTPLVPGELDSDPPRDTRVERTVPFDTDPAPPPDGDPERSDGGSTARVRRSRSRERARLPLDTIPEDSDRPAPDAPQAELGRIQHGPPAQDRGQNEQNTAAGGRRSLWRQPQASLPPRPSLSVSAVPRPAVKASPEKQGATRAAPTPKHAASSAAKTEKSPEPDAATAPDDQPSPLVPLGPATPGPGSASSVAAEQPERRLLLPSPAPADTRAGMLSDAPTNPRQDALPPAADAVVSPQAGPDGAAQPTPAPAPELQAVGAVDDQKAKEPGAADEAIEEPPETSGAHVENVTVVRFRLDALRARYLRLMVAVAVVAAACAAIVTALLMRRATPVSPHRRAIRLSDPALHAPAATRAIPHASVTPVETPTTSVETLSVEALPTESPASTQASPDESRPDSDTAPTRALPGTVAARPRSLAKPGVAASETAQSRDTKRVEAKPARDAPDADAAKAKPRAAAASQPDPAGEASPAPASEAPSPAPAPAKDWKANDPGF